jgi:hypothetical protein
MGERPKSEAYMGGTYTVGFTLLNSKGRMGPGQPHLQNGFPGVDFFVRESDYKVVGRNFGSLWY